MHTFRQSARLRAQANWVLIPGLVVALTNLGTFRSWRYGLMSVPFALQATALCLLAGTLLASALDQRYRQVVVDGDGLHTRRLFHSAFVGWDIVRDVQVQSTWVGDFVVVATPKRMVRLDAPHLLVRSGAARRDFEAGAEALQRAIAEHGVFTRPLRER
jgi:hypothetical protein